MTELSDLKIQGYNPTDIADFLFVYLDIEVDSLKKFSVARWPGFDY